MGAGRRFVGVLAALAVVATAFVAPAGATSKLATVDGYLRSPGLQPFVRMARDFGATRQLETLLRLQFEQAEGAPTEEFAFTYPMGISPAMAWPTSRSSIIATTYSIRR